MSDLISKKDTLAKFDPVSDWSAYQIIKGMPSAEKIGHWIWQTEDIYRCSECHEDLHVKEVMNEPQYEWCPMCGVYMKGVSECQEKNEITQ